jgi:hypothetical protein
MCWATPFLEAITPKTMVTLGEEGANPEWRGRALGAHASALSEDGVSGTGAPSMRPFTTPSEPPPSARVCIRTTYTDTVRRLEALGIKPKTPPARPGVRVELNCSLAL